MKTIPHTVSLCGATPEFTEDTIPQSLRRSHRTAATTWGRIVVSDGRLRYRVLEPEARETELSPGAPGVVEPGVPHEVEALGKVRFHVEFYR